MMCKILFSAKIVLALAAGLSVFALIGALSGQLFFDLPPCKMCIYQRIPFLVVALVAGAGLVWAGLRLFALMLSALAFATNTGLAFYHSGIEQGWFVETQGCAVSFDVGGGVQSLLQKMTTAQTDSCADIVWSDPFFGLTMANYNMAVCFALTVLCAGGIVSFYRARKA